MPPGGAKSYIVRGKMTEGFAFVTYPAEYPSSGIKSITPLSALSALG